MPHKKIKGATGQPFLKHTHSCVCFLTCRFYDQILYFAAIKNSFIMLEVFFFKHVLFQAIVFAYSRRLICIYNVILKACSFLRNMSVRAGFGTCHVWSQQVRMRYTIFRVQREDVLKGRGQEVNRFKCSACPHLYIQKQSREFLCVVVMSLCSGEVAFFFHQVFLHLLCFGSGFGLMLAASACPSSFHQKSQPLSVLLEPFAEGFTVRKVLQSWHTALTYTSSRTVT